MSAARTDALAKHLHVCIQCKTIYLQHTYERNEWWCSLLAICRKRMLNDYVPHGHCLAARADMMKLSRGEQLSASDLDFMCQHIAACPSCSEFYKQLFVMDL